MVKPAVTVERVFYGDRKMFALYYKRLHIIKEPMTKNCTCQTYRGKQLAICEDEKPLQDYIDKQKDKDRYYIEKMGF